MIRAPRMFGWIAISVSLAMLVTGWSSVVLRGKASELKDLRLLEVQLTDALAKDDSVANLRRLNERLQMQAKRLPDQEQLTDLMARLTGDLDSLGVRNQAITTSIMGNLADLQHIQMEVAFRCPSETAYGALRLMTRGEYLLRVESFRASRTIDGPSPLVEVKLRLATLMKPSAEE